MPNIEPFNLKPVIEAELLLYTAAPHIMLLLEMLFLEKKKKKSN